MAVNEPAWPPDFTAWTHDDWSALGTCLTAVIAIVAAGVAWRQVREAARLRREQAEPYVAVWMEQSKAAPNYVDLVIKNFGATAAYDIEVAIEPAPLRCKKGDTESVYIPPVIRTLVPGQEWRTYWDFGPRRMEMGLPDLHEVVARFRSYSGSRKHGHEYRFQLDWSDWKHAPILSVYSVHDIAKSLRDIQRKVDRWTEIGGGLKVVARDGDAKDGGQREEFEEYRRQRAEESSDEDGDGS